MLKRLSGALLTAALVAAADPTLSPAWSKPPDLPIDTKEICKLACHGCPVVYDTGSFFPCMVPSTDLVDMATEQIVNQESQASPYRIQLGDCVIDLDDLAKAWEEWGPQVQNWITESVKDPLAQGGKVLDAVGDIVNETMSNIVRVNPNQSQAVPDGAMWFVPTLGSIPSMGSSGIPLPPPARSTSYCAPALPPSTHGPVAEKCLTAAMPVACAAPQVETLPYPTEMPCDNAARCHKPADDSVEATYRLHSAECLLVIGERCQAQGDVAMARNCYEEVERLCPGSDCAAQANALMAKLDPKKGTRDLIHETAVDVHKIDETKRMFRLGERYERAGDMSNACACFHEASVICPACAYGQKAQCKVCALERMSAQERGEDGFEEQEPPISKPAMSDSDWQKREEARHLYQLGEHCRVGGDLRMAVDFYQDARRSQPRLLLRAAGKQRISRMKMITIRHLRAIGKTEAIKHGPRRRRLQRGLFHWNFRDKELTSFFDPSGPLGALLNRGFPRSPTVCLLSPSRTFCTTYAR